MIDLAGCSVSSDATMAEVLAAIDRGGAQIALVIDEYRAVIGTVTDGDLRRALLRGYSMSTHVKELMHREFRWLPSNASEQQVLDVMRRETIHQIPVLDRDGRAVRLFRLEDLIRPMLRSNPVLIMAGGKGSRLGALTHRSPKPMLQVGGKAILEIILEQCIESGFRNFYFSVNYLKEHIQGHFGDGAAWQVSIKYVEEEKPLGTAGALSKLPVMPVHPLLVLNGDVLTRVDFGRLLNFHAEHESAATVCVREHITQIPYGVVRMDDIVVEGMEEKPTLSQYVNAGIYILEPNLLELVPSDQFFDMPQLLERAIAHKHRVSAFPIHEYWLDIGLPETLDRAHQEWR